MTGNKVGQWIPNRAQLSSKIMGDLDANLNEFEQSQPSEEDREEAKPSPMFAQTIRKGMKNVHCLPVDINLLTNKFDLQE